MTNRNSELAKTKLEALMMRKEKFEEKLRKERSERNRQIKKMEAEVERLRKEEFESVRAQIGVELCKAVNATSADEALFIKNYLLDGSVLNDLKTAFENKDEETVTEDLEVADEVTQGEPERNYNPFNQW